MSYALQLVRERKSRLARMESRAWVPPYVEPEPVVIEALQSVTFPEHVVRQIEVLSHGCPSIASIVSVVATHRGVSGLSLISARRDSHLAMARHIAMYLAKHLTTRSLQEIGHRLGGRDHTTILYGAGKIEGLMRDDEQLRASIEMLTEQLTSSRAVPQK
jgi:hypothetical protein